MKKEETNEIISLLLAAYPNAFKKMDSGEMRRMLMLYEVSFKNDEYETVSKAVVEAIGKMKFLPSIAEIRELMPKQEEESNDEMPDNYELPFYQYSALIRILGEELTPGMLDWYKKHYWESMHPKNENHGRYVKGASR